jgi:hypothetical protein
MFAVSENKCIARFLFDSTVPILLIPCYTSSDRSTMALTRLLYSLMLSLNIAAAIGLAGLLAFGSVSSDRILTKTSKIIKYNARIDE